MFMLDIDHGWQAKMRKKKKGKRWKNRWVVLQGGSMVHDSSPTITYCDWNKVSSHAARELSHL